MKPVARMPVARRFVGVPLLGLLPLLGLAQVARPAETTEGVDFRVMNAFGPTANTNSGVLGGLAFRQLRTLKRESIPTFRYLSVELVNVRHPKERAYALNTGSRFIIGKQNYLFALRGQWGRERTLFRRADRGGVQLDGVLAGGPTLGLLKPYYVEIVTRQNPRQTQQVPYTPALENDPNVYIVGGGSLFNGFGQLRVVPGLNAKVGVAIELDAFSRTSIGLETGFLVEAYAREIILIPEAQNRQVFTSGYLTLFFGTKR
jgi:hypothetical protein